MKFKFVFLHIPFVVYIESIVDLIVLDEVFTKEEYNWMSISDPKIIIDLGAHFGDTALYYHLKYPHAHVYAVEPAPETFKRLSKNVSSIENITAINAGIAEKDGFADLNIVRSSLGNSFKSRSDIQSTVSVPVCTLATLFKQHNIQRADIIKFDIEGAEELLFNSNVPQDYADAYIGEVHRDLMSIDSATFISKFEEFNVEEENLNTSRFIVKAILKNTMSNRL